MVFEAIQGISKDFGRVPGSFMGLNRLPGELALG